MKVIIAIMGICKSALTSLSQARKKRHLWHRLAAAYQLYSGNEKPSFITNYLDAVESSNLPEAGTG